MGDEYEYELQELDEFEYGDDVDDLNANSGDEFQDVGSQSPSKTLNKVNSGATLEYYGNFPQNPQVQKKKKLRHYDRIVTNPKYKAFDIESCGSAFFKNLEYHNEEIDIRDMIKKVESRKQRREKRRKKKLQI